MNLAQAKKFIKINEIMDKDEFCYIAENLRRLYSKYSKKIEFEFSFSTKKGEVGFHYEPSYNLDAPLESLTVLKKEASRFIYDFLKELNNRHKAKFDLGKISKVTDAAGKSEFLFMHFGFELNNGRVSRIKIYLVPLNNIVPNINQRFFSKVTFDELTRVAAMLKFRRLSLRAFSGDDLNAFGLDFPRECGCTLKVYKSFNPLQKRNASMSGFNKGLLNFFNNFDRIKDYDIMFRLAQAGSNTVLPSKIYFYPKPRLKIQELRNDRISLRLKDMCKEFKAGDINASIYAISLDGGSAPDVYIR